MSATETPSLWQLLGLPQSQLVQQVSTFLTQVRHAPHVRQTQFAT